MAKLFAEITELGKTDLLPVADHYMSAGNVQPRWLAEVDHLPVADVINDTDGHLAERIVNRTFVTSPLTLGTPARQPSQIDTRTGKTIVTYTIPFEGDPAILTTPKVRPQHFLKGDIENKAILFRYEIARSVGDAASKLQQTFELDHGSLKNLVKQFTDEQDTARQRAILDTQQALEARRQREGAQQSLDQQLQERLDDYLNRQQ